jgi:TRAP-type uncharacterized transport system substrate-binding protein
VAAANPITTRSQVMLEIANELVTQRGHPYRQLKIAIQEQNASRPELGLLSWATRRSIEAVVKGEAALAIMNPAAGLALAHRGEVPFGSPQPVAAVTVIPSMDQLVFAVRPEHGLKTLGDIASKRAKLRIGLRGNAEHSLDFMVDEIMEACGCPLEAIRAWGGDPRKQGFLPDPKGPKFKALVSGELDAVFDEAASAWVGQALDAGMSILSVPEPALRKLEAKGYRRALIRKSDYPKLPADVETVDFSGFPIFTHAQASDELVTKLCAALDARKERIEWEGEGPLPLERMCRDAPDTPQQTPLHPAAERYWRSRGYL